MRAMEVPFPPVPPGEPIDVSATLYRTWSSCPDQALGRLQGEYPEPGRAGVTGSLAHRVFARHLRQGNLGAPLEQACREELGQDANLGRDLNRAGLGKPSALRAVVEAVGDLYRRFVRFPAEGFREAEVPLEVEVADGVRLRGRVDAVFVDEEGERLLDWKTGSDLEGAEEQLSFYLLAWILARGSTPAAAEAISMRTGERVTVRPDPERLAATAQAVARLVTDAREAFAAGGRLERRGGAHCRWCPLLETCPEGASALQILDGRPG